MPLSRGPLATKSWHNCRPFSFIGTQLEILQSCGECGQLRAIDSRTIVSKRLPRAELVANRLRATFLSTWQQKVYDASGPFFWQFSEKMKDAFNAIWRRNFIGQKNRAANEAIGRFDGKKYSQISLGDQRSVLFVCSFNQWTCKWSRRSSFCLARSARFINFCSPSNLSRFPPMEMAQVNSGRQLSIVQFRWLPSQVPICWK